ncbi:MAG: ion transporter [Lachnospiraceae bacterium]|nr:ion transporter [Lachnospiraceae bacterium]MBR4816445.1 ion transporter [Lachnospiraceae bacterium]
MRKKIFNIIQIGSRDNMPSRMFDIGLTVVILLNILVTFLQTFDELSELSTVFMVIEGVTVIVFCIEYILRLITADYLYPEDSKVKSRLHFMVSFDGVVDLLTILPFVFLSGFIAFRILRIVRIFHLFRINTQYDSFNVIRLVIHDRWKQIGSSLVIIFIIMLAASLGMYSVEHAENEGFENAFSGMWWSVSALLTVGYGDIYPITVIGKIMGIIIAFAGVGLVAIPTGIISAGFVEQYRLNSESERNLTDVEKIGEIVLSHGHEFVGKKVIEVKEKYGCTLYLVIRDELTLLPTDTLILKENDIAVIRSEKLAKNEKNKKTK